MFPDLSKETFRDFSQVAYLGAFIISFDNAIVGIVLYYSHHLPALWTAFALYWVAVALTIIVSFAAVPISCCYQQPHAISEVSGVWLLAFVPLIVTSAVGSTLVPHLPSTPSQLTLTVSFLSWSLGQAICSIILCIYLWRLLTASLPSRDLIISGFVPMGPTGEGAFSIQNLSTGLGNHIEKKSYALPIGELPRTRVSMTAVAEGINWLGVFIALCLVALATFWMAQAALSVILRVPKRFNVGFWSCVFPFAVYTNALSRLAQDLNNSGFRGWAATCAVVTTLLWLICALATFWQGVVKGQPFFAPGKEGWQEKGALKERLKAGSGSDVEA
ncbi:hypothetical protein EV356DRAFT_529700 [Viridothelium virens]|uniref:C4-dicarboxylate transporter/malic acid transport protein n=1 Tax=Viridothelium virens TaxID=1048519 RepID=A0A6A6HJS3_VIRVR|nr:hypothetical protein EV356DRAFT_529700 [Viridothelium virens]